MRRLGLVLALVSAVGVGCSEDDGDAEVLDDEASSDDDGDDDSADDDSTGDDDAADDDVSADDDEPTDDDVAADDDLETDDDGADDDSTPNIVVPPACPGDVEDLAEAFAEAVCEKRGECCNDDYETCITEVTDAIDAIYVDVAEAVENGDAELDCASFDACAGAIADAECGQWPLQSGELGEIPVDEPSCREMMTPLLEAGEACSYSYQCIDGFCQAELGMCVAFAEENEACEDSLCNLMTHYCNAAGVCQERLDDGVACTDPSECFSGICDVEGTGECIAPGDDQCEYVPRVPAACSVRATNGERRSLALIGLGVFALVRLRRRRAVEQLTAPR